MQFGMANPEESQRCGRNLFIAPAFTPHRQYAPYNVRLGVLHASIDS